MSLPDNHPITRSLTTLKLLSESGITLERYEMLAMDGVVELPFFKLGYDSWQQVLEAAGIPYSHVNESVVTHSREQAVAAMRQAMLETGIRRKMIPQFYHEYQQRHNPDLPSFWVLQQLFPSATDWQQLLELTGVAKEPEHANTADVGWLIRGLATGNEQLENMARAALQNSSLEDLTHQLQYCRATSEHYEKAFECGEIISAYEESRRSIMQYCQSIAVHIEEAIKVVMANQLREQALLPAVSAFEDLSFVQDDAAGSAPNTH